MAEQATARCPRCGFEQPAGPECARCGVVFAKLRDRHERAASEQSDPPPAPDGARHRGDSSISAASPPPGAGVTPGAEAGGGGHRRAPPGGATPSGHRQLPPRPVLDPLDQPIGRLAWTVRALAVLACFGIAAVLFSSGRAGHSFWLYVVAIFYTFFGLWVAVSVGTRPPTRRFAVEMLVLVFASLAFRAALPEVFTLEEGKRRGTVALGATSTDTAALVEEGDAVVRVLDTVLREGKLPAGMRQARLRELLQLEKLDRLRANAPATARGDFRDTYTALRDAAATVRQAIRGPVLPGAPVDLDGTQRQTLRDLLAEAQTRLDALRASN